MIAGEYFSCLFKGLKVTLTLTSQKSYSLMTIVITPRAGGALAVLLGNASESSVARFCQMKRIQVCLSTFRW
jgi:hypothetical protein